MVTINCGHWGGYSSPFLTLERIFVNELALFAGVGGGILGGKLLGWRTVCAVEIERYAACVLIQRQNDGLLPPFPIWDDIRTFDGRPWRGLVDVVSGGFPCQDISCAGTGAGLSGKRSGLWFEMLRILSEVRPRLAFMENSSVLTVRGLDTVLGGLAEIGYNAEWCVLGASDCGAPHYRKRIWILAYTSGKRFEKRIKIQSEDKKERIVGSCSNVPYTNITGLERQFSKTGTQEIQEIRNSCSNVPDSDIAGLESIREIEDRKNGRETRRAPFTNSWWETEPGLGRVANGVANRVDRLKAIGNGQVPDVARKAWNILINRIGG
jgi:DNA (cytosine-5)-methyltransferase 1